MNYLLFFCLFLNAGCVIIVKQNDNKDVNSKSILSLEEKEQIWIEGASLNSFVQAWGEPESMIADKTTAILYYDTAKGPFKFIFVNRKLSSWRAHYGKLNEVMTQHHFHSNIVGN